MTDRVEPGRERPLGVAVIALFLIVDSVLAIGEVALDMPITTSRDVLLEAGAWMPAVVVAIALLRILAAIGLWLGWRRAWVFTMLLVGIGLVWGIVMYWLAEPNHLRLAVSVVMSFYLNQGVVRDWFTPSARRP